ncbi:MAG: hypothetical protein ACK4FZ_01620 [Vogesella sp.]|uniref:hypothetical protein n=1 Tax=Vogesella sp. TaxID=1904252 RepID=UPI00391A5DD4
MHVPSRHDSTLLQLNETWHQHRIWLTAMLQQPWRLTGQCLRESSGESACYRRIILRALADQTALSYDALDLVQSYESVLRDWSRQYPIPSADNWWQWHSMQRKRQQRVLLTLIKSVLQGCQVSLASEKQAA